MSDKENNTTVTVDHQRLVVSGLLKDAYLLSLVGSELNDGYFSDGSCRLIYKSLMDFYEKYQKIPTKVELNLTIEKNFIELGVDLNTVQELASKMYDEPAVDESYLIDQSIDLIKRIRIRRALTKSLEMIKDGSALDDERLSNELISSLTVNFNKSGIFTLSDFNQLSNARRKALGDNENQSVIKSVLPSMNTTLQYNGYQKGTLNLIVSPPGCFTGDTMIMTLDGKSHSIESLYNSKCMGIYGSDKYGNLSTDIYDSVYLSKYTNELVEVVIDGKYKVRCTPDHPFMLRSGDYVQAKDLTSDCELMPITRKREQLYSIGAEYEIIYNKDNVGTWTHHSSARLVPHDESCKVIHHKDRNKLNNLPSNIEWFLSSKEHAKYHYDSGDYESFIENGKKTRFNSERTSEMNKLNWKNPEYREFMRKVSHENGKKYGACQLNNSESHQKYNRKCKVLSYINKLIHENGIPTYDDYELLSNNLDSKYKVSKLGIAKSYDCNIKVDDNPRHDIIDESKLRYMWDTIIDDAVKYNHKVTSVTNIVLDKEVPVYGIVNAGSNHNYALALDNDHGVIVSNTGKTSYLINEGSYAALQGFNVLHVFLGDMVEYDGFIRYASCISGRLQNEVIGMTLDQQSDLVANINNQFTNVMTRISILAYGSGEINVDTLIENIKKEQDRLNVKFDDIIIDYADNFDKDNSQMYVEGGYIYDRLALFGRLNGSVVMVASQPKIGYWKDEIIPLEGAAESSKKQHIVDLLATFNLVNREAKIGTIFVPKVRRGVSGRLIRVETHWECCRINEISEDDYAGKKGELNVGNK